jgi:hypothetical protein
MSRALARKSPWRDDVRIVYLGVWGFLLQCLKTCFGGRREPENHG